MIRVGSAAVPSRAFRSRCRNINTSRADVLALDRFDVIEPWYFDEFASGNLSHNY